MDKDQKELLEELHNIRFSSIFRLLEVIQTLPEHKKQRLIKLLGYDGAPHMVDERLTELDKLVWLAYRIRQTVPDPEELESLED